jgi:tight adherence protein B
VLIVALTFASVMALIIAPYWLLVLRPEGAAHATLLKRLRTGSRQQLSRLGVLKTDGQQKRPGRLDELVSRSGGPGRRLNDVVVQSGLSITPGQLVLLCIAVGLVAGFIVLTLTRSPWIGAAVGAAALSIPYAWVRRVATTRMRRFEEQFPEAIDLLARALRAGHAFTTALSMVPDEIPDPVGTEFKLLYDQQNYGMSLPDALRAFALRIPVLEARFFVTAVLTQREVGGNLSEVLDNLAAVMRERFKVKRQVRVISAHGRITGWILAGLPPCLALVLFVMSPDHMRILIEDPLGVQMIVVAIVLQITGTLIIRRIVNVEY